MTEGNQMKDPYSSIQELREENALLKQRIQELEKTDSERKKAEEILRASEDHYRDLVENSLDLICTHDLNGQLLSFNETAVRLSGYPRELLLKMNLREGLMPEMRNRSDAYLDEIKKKGRAQGIMKIQTAAGEIRYWEYQNTLRADHPDGPVVRGMARDITERRRMEKALRDSEEKYRLLFESAAEGILIVQGEVIRFANPALAEILGYSQDTITSRPFVEFIHPEDRSIILEHHIKRMRGDDVQTGYSFRVISADRTVKWLQIFSRVISWEGVKSSLNFVTDITDRKWAEAALRENEERFRLIMENINDTLWLMDMNMKPTWISPSVERTRGYSLEELRSLPLDKHVTPASLPRVLELINKYLTPAVLDNPHAEMSISEELEFYRKDGTTFWADTVITLLRNGQGLPIGFLGVSRDITDRKRAEEALRESEDKYRKLAETANDLIVTIDLDGIITYANRAAIQLAGEINLVGIPLKNMIPLDLVARHKEMLEERSRGYEGTRSYEWVLQSPVQKDIPLLIDIKSSLLYDQGKPSGVLFIARDITERKQVEEAKHILEERLQRSEKMETLGQLAGGVAHDLNNVLGILSGYSELLLLEMPEGSRSRGHVEKILRSTEKGAAIIQDLLTLARRGVTASEVIDLNGVVSGFLKTPVFEKMKDYHPRVTFRAECDQNLLSIKGSPVHLEKTLINLVSNAVESISGEGEVTIRTESRYLDKAIRGYDEVKEGDYAVLTVSDTGTGIPVEYREKIFEPFYTKKAMGRSGTGLGLAIVWGTVKDHDGYIDFQTEVGKGTTFTLYFPVTREEMIAPRQKEPMERYMGKGESVLVVDDIAEQRDVASGLLTRLGYNARVVSSGEEAVEYLKGNKADIIVLDMIMAPGIDGLETYRRLLVINPNQKAIIVSGFSETDRVREAQKLGAGAYVKKPYMMEKIGVAIRKELDGKSGSRSSGTAPSS
jgi:PAS domain S-box-containing protein